MSSTPCYSWLEQINNIITITASATAKIKASYKKRGSSVAFIEISEEPIFRGDDVWEISTSFTRGEYLVKISVVDDPYKEEIISLLKVYSAEEFNSVYGFIVMSNQIEQLSNELEALKTITGVNKNFKTAG